jgi:hypothetical protein
MLIRAIFAVVATVAINGQTATAQLTTPVTSTYAATVSYHVPSESRAAFEAWLKDKGRRFIDALMKEDASLKDGTIVMGQTIAPAAASALPVITLNDRATVHVNGA